MSLARPFKAGKDDRFLDLSSGSDDLDHQPSLTRRRSLSLTRIPALKRRAKIISTQRVEMDLKSRAQVVARHQR